MKKVIMMLLASSLIFSACGAKKDANANDDNAATAAATTDVKRVDVDSSEALKRLEGLNLDKVDSVKTLFKEEGKMSALEYESLLVARSLCQYDEKSNAFKKCDAVTNASINALLAKYQLADDARLEVLRKLAKSNQNAVRGAVYEQLNTIANGSGMSPDEQAKRLDEILALGQAENDGYALSALIGSLGAKSAAHKGTRDFVLAKGTHENPFVRDAVADIGRLINGALTDGEKEAYHAMYLKMLTDANARVVGHACAQLHDFNDVKDLAEVDKVLAKVDEKDPSSHVLCVQALTAYLRMGWDGAETAYQSLVKYFSSSASNLPVYQAFLHAPSQKDFDKAVAKNPNITPNALIDAYKALASNKDKDQLVRTEAMKGLAKIGTKADLESIQASIPGSKNEASLQKAYDNALKKMK